MKHLLVRFATKSFYVVSASLSFCSLRYSPFLLACYSVSPFFSLEEIVAGLVLRLEAHLALPSLAQVLLHLLVFLKQSVVLEGLRLDLVLDEFLVLSALHLAASLAQLTLRVDLVGQVHLQEVLLLLLTIQVALDLVESFFGAEMRLVVEGIDGLLDLLSALLLSDLVADVVAVGTVLLHTVLVFECLLSVHVVDSRVELLLLALSRLLNVVHVLVEAGQSLLVDVANRFITATALVGCVVVHREGALRAEELRHRGVVLVRNFLAIQSRFHLVHVLNNAGRGDFGACKRHAIEGVDDEALIVTVLVHDTRLVVQVLIVRDLLLGHVDFGETERARVHSGCEGVRVVTAHAHHVSCDDQLVAFLAFRGARLERPAG
mmetsp:Transcript_20328/g.27484  ORF Transcript_20328/g.27484 Transcript_20328/m.27484 type:complete len:376 (-) Transcript_20328:1275-2402(-)